MNWLDILLLLLVGLGFVKGLFDGVVKQAQRYGDRDRYIYKVKKEERHFTYNDMLTHVNYISSAMTRLGVAGSFVGVTGDTHPDYVATYLATVACGGVIVPLDKDSIMS